MRMVLPFNLKFWHGTLLQRKHIKNNAPVSKRDYLRGKELSNDLMESVYHEDGRVIKSGNTWQYEYWLKDHLGNIRATFSDANGNNIITDNERKSRNDYYSFGLEWNNRWDLSDTISPLNLKRYNGKELVTEINLDVLELPCQNDGSSFRSFLDTRYIVTYYAILERIFLWIK